MNATAIEPELELFSGSVSAVRREDLGAGCTVALFERFARSEHAAWFEQLERTLPWVQEVYFRGGRCVPAPRLTSFHGDPGCRYTYSGIGYEPAPWTDLLLAVRARLRAATGYGWNSMLANLYRDGRDSVGYHADAEPELGPSRDDIAIASLSLGDARRFVMKHRKSGELRSYELGHGALLVMSGRTQLEWVHALPKTRRAVAARINLTFRVIDGRAARDPEGARAPSLKDRGAKRIDDL
jgi:alkylated DNA repair dioxygenase AlkB